MPGNVRKRDDIDEVDWLGVEGTPSELGEDQWGKWRSIPGIPQELLSVSSRGYVRGVDGKPVGQMLTANCYLVVKPKDAMKFMEVESPLSVRTLVCRAFHGPRERTDDVVANIDMTGSMLKQRTDNRAENLKWLPATEWTAHQLAAEALGKQKKGKGKPVLIRRTDWPEGQTMRFPNQSKAAEWIQTRENLPNTPAGKAMGTAAKSNGEKLIAGFYKVFEALDEPNEPLPATQHDRLSGMPEKEEEWAYWPYLVNPKTGQRVAEVSSRGRIRTLFNSVLSNSITPVPKDGCKEGGTYAEKFFDRMYFTYNVSDPEQIAKRAAKEAAGKASGDNDRVYFHHMVWSIFGKEAREAGHPIWPVPKNPVDGSEMYIGYVDGNTSNNNASNLALITAAQKGAKSTWQVVPRDLGGVPFQVLQEQVDPK